MTNPVLVSAFLAMLERELRIALATRGTLWIMPSFVILACAVLAFALSPFAAPPAALFAANSGLLLCFAAMLGLQGFLVRDAENDVFAFYALCGRSLLLFLCAKLLVFVLLRGLPTAGIAALSLLFYPRVPMTFFDAIAFAAPILGLCSIALSAVALFVAALTLNSERRAELALLVALPLFLPPLLFCIAALEAHLSSRSSEGAVLLLLGVALLSLSLLPLACLLLSPQDYEKREKRDEKR